MASQPVPWRRIRDYTHLEESVQRRRSSFQDTLVILRSRDEAKRLLADVGFCPVPETEGSTSAGIQPGHIIFQRC